MKKRESNIKIGWHFYITLVLLILAGIYIKSFMFDEMAITGKPLKGFPHMIGSWKNVANNKLSDDVLDILKVDDYVLRNFRNDEGENTSLYIGYYATHRRSAEIHSPENCQVGGGWEVLSQKKQELDVPGIKEKLNFTEAVYEKDQEKMVFLYWYYVNGKYITNFFSYKFNVIINSLVYHRTDASFVRITVPIVNDDINGALNTAESFLIEAVPVITTFLP